MLSSAEVAHRSDRSLADVIVGVLGQKAGRERVNALANTGHALC